VQRVLKKNDRKNRDVFGPGCIKGQMVLTGEADVEDRWKDHFVKLLNEEVEWSKDGLCTVDKLSG
jgi:hypothetical protein